MLRNYLVVAGRNLLKYKAYSSINIAGLAIGLACSALILLHVRDEFSYDSFHVRAERIYRVGLEWQFDADPTQYLPHASGLLAPALERDVPGIERAVRLAATSWAPGPLHMARGSEQGLEENGFYADAGFFQVFSFPLLSGAGTTALEQPFSIVLTQAMARRYFGDSEAVGQSLTLQDSLEFTVTGVLAPLPANAHFRFDFLLSFDAYETWGHPLRWGRFGCYTYVLLAESATAASLAPAVRDITRAYIGVEEDKKGFRFKHFLQPLPDIYLHSDMPFDIGPSGDIAYVYAFACIACFILLLSGINFVNLTTARSALRAREVGLRKLVGSQPRQLVVQFLGEAVLIALLALVLALLLVALALPEFNRLLGKDLRLDFWADPLLGLVFLCLAVGLGALAGSYPAVALSRVRPVELWGGWAPAGAKGRRLRKGLIVCQFAAAAVLVSGTGVVYRQLEFMRSQNLGFDAAQVVVVDMRGLEEMQRLYPSIKAAFLQDSQVWQAAATRHVPGQQFGEVTLPVSGAEGEQQMTFVVHNADPDFAETFSLRLVAGRDFSAARALDTTAAFVLNEAAVAYLGWGDPGRAIGREATLGPGGAVGRLIGVVEDFHYHSLQRRIAPMLLWAWGQQPLTFRYLAVKIAAGDIPGTLARLEKIWLQHVPERDFRYSFLSADYDRQYRSEEQLGRIFAAFAVLALGLAGLGLTGLVAFTVHQRRREIGIRKVLGAPVWRIVMGLGAEFIKPVVWANLIAWPLAWWAMDQWLQGFAYRTQVGGGLLAGAALVGLAHVLLLVGYQTVKAAWGNPVEVLKSQ